MQDVGMAFAFRPVAVGEDGVSMIEDPADRSPPYHVLPGGESDIGPVDADDNGNPHPSVGQEGHDSRRAGIVRMNELETPLVVEEVELAPQTHVSEEAPQPMQHLSWRRRVPEAPNLDPLRPSLRGDRSDLLEPIAPRCAGLPGSKQEPPQSCRWEDPLWDNHRRTAVRHQVLHLVLDEYAISG